MTKKQFGVIGLGTFGSNVAKELFKRDFPVLAIDHDEELVNKISPFVTQAIVADATDDNALKNAGITDCDSVIISIGEDVETSILATLIVKDLGVKNVIVKCVSQWHSKIAVKIGADKVVYPELEMAKKLAESMVSPNILEQIEFSHDYNLVEIIAPKEFWGKTIKSSGVRNKYGINIIAIKRQIPFVNDDGQTDIKEDTNIAPGPDDEILENDVLVVVGKQEELEKLKKI
ncbi:MAG: TrkA family potassium uptake protein [Endomicrobiia bacterium]|jgi:trk system potassium uptake protein TrkA|nr:TrkA family potassium uptake protein [Endomicrobiaceae bacterium]MDD3923126.1 TrkA family potassium uptake protein [Endomicrobiaceae bacterium]MDD5101935.1 TrkA family potassium uptake protein [Endomicrobiaceae bacterium]